MNSPSKIWLMERIEDLERHLLIIKANAVLIPDPQMQGLTDTYAVPLDDINEIDKLIIRKE